MEKQQKKKRVLWVMLAIFITAIIAVWCIFIFVYIIKPVQNSWSKAADSETQESRNHAKEEKRKEEVLAYLEERYGEEFEIASYRGMSYAYDYVQMYAYPKGYSDEAHQFKIQGRLNGEGKMEYVDSYVMVKLTDDYEAYIDPIIGEYFDEYKCYVRFDSEWLTNNLPTDTQLEDLWELHANADYPLPRIFLYLKSNQKEKYNDNSICKMAEKLQKSNVRGLLSVVFYYNDDIYTMRNRENVYEALEDSVNDVDGNNIFIYNDRIEY